MGGSRSTRPDWLEPPGGRFSILDRIDWDRLTRVLERDLLWFTGEHSLTLAGSPSALDWVLARRDLEGDLRLVGGDTVSRLSNTVRLLGGDSSLGGGLDLALFALIFALDFLLETGDVGGLGGG